jgi:hypothetical protein
MWSVGQESQQVQCGFWSTARIAVRGLVSAGLLGANGNYCARLRLPFPA